jgi:hypothetical protein
MPQMAFPEELRCAIPPLSGILRILCDAVYCQEFEGAFYAELVMNVATATQLHIGMRRVA